MERKARIIRRASARYLGMLGTGSEQVRTALRIAKENDNDYFVRDFAGKALNRLQAEAEPIEK